MFMLILVVLLFGVSAFGFLIQGKWTPGFLAYACMLLCGVLAGLLDIIELLEKLLRG
jgi:hypothetical protein